MPRWPFIAGDVVLLALAWLALPHDGTPPGLGAIILAAICVIAGIALLLAPFLLDYEAHLRLAEAAVREAADQQARKLAQTAEQLAHAVSRSQSTEEQAGQALGALEELAEKLGAQADELAQVATRLAEREQTGQKAELDRLVQERDDALAALDARVSTVAAVLAEAQAASRKAASTTARALEEVRNRFDDLNARLDRAPEAGPPAAPADETADAAGPAASSAPASAAPPAPSSPPVPAAPLAAAEAPPVELVDARAEPAALPEEPAAPPPASEEKPAPPRERAKPARTNGGEPPAPRAARPADLELPLEGLSELRPARRRESSVTSLVATAYIGIGNKLFLRGEGPGLSWERGVPMQFLAIGKWGWTTTDADEPITCRLFRNDDTPMLDENIVIAPGAKAEVAPRF